MKDYYKILGVPLTAGEDQLRQVYRQKAKLLHPDLNNNNPQAAEKLIEVNEAYAVLSDKEKRAEYNRAFRQNAQQNAFRQQGAPGAGFSQQQIPIEQMTAAAYNQGYAKGYNDSTARYAEKDAAYERQIRALNERIHAADAEKRSASRKIKDLENEVGELSAQNESLWIQVADSRDEASGGAHSSGLAEQKLREEAARTVDGLSAKLKDANNENDLLKERQKSAEEAAYEKEMEINRLKEEVKALGERLVSYEQYVNSRESEDSLDALMHEREDKLKQVKKMIKNTYYGTLGVVYWADNEEIYTAYDKLKRRYEQKYQKGDFKAKQKLAELENAYNTLIDETARKSYNATIDITAADIALEKQEQRDYETAMEKHLADKAEDEFWAYVDELMFLSQTGDAESQNLLGEMYYYGDEIEQDLDQAFYWFKEAAKQQHPEALLSLGKCYLNGEGTARDETKGLGFIKQAAKLGNAEAAAYFGKK